jgi:hypothetical protein
MTSGNGGASSDEWRDFDFSTVEVEKSRATRILPKHEALRFLAVGLLSGVAVWLLRLAIANWVMQPIFCKTPDTASVCANIGPISFTISLIIVGIIAITILASRRVFRAAVITLATFISLGALWPLLDPRSTVVSTILTAAFAVGLYLFFALIAAVKRYTLAVTLITVLVVAFWLLVRM